MYQYVQEITVLPEQPVAGKPLGRHVNHDSRSKAYAVTPRASATLKSVRWTRRTPILDQGDLGSCTGNATVGALGTEPHFSGLSSTLSLDEALAVAIYKDATRLDSFTGTYLPTDTGSDGLSAAKAAKARGLISGYTHCFSLDAVLTALQTGPVITGVSWYEGFDSPDANGLVRLSGQARGGHEFELVGLDLEAKQILAANSWGESYGDRGYFSFSFDDYAALLAEQGDATVLVPLTAPAPVPTPPPLPTPVPTPAPVTDLSDVALAKALKPWLAKTPFFYKDIQAATRSWLVRKGL